MGYEQSPITSNVADERNYRLRLLGTGASVPERDGDEVGIGYGMTVSRTAAGVYKITWASNPGRFVGFSWALGAATPGDVKGHTVTRDEYSNTDSVFTLEVALWNASDAADDLQATEYMDLCFTFKESAY